MGQRFTEEQLEQMIMQLEQGGLLQAPPSLENWRGNGSVFGAAGTAYGSWLLRGISLRQGTADGTGGRRKGKPAGLYAAGNENPQRWCDRLFRFRNETYYGGI